MNNNQNNNEYINNNATGMDIVNNLDNKETSKHFVKSLILIEIIVFIFGIIIFNYHNSKSNVNFDFTKFNDILSKNGYLIIPDNDFNKWDTHGYIKSYYTADKNDIHFEYLECVDNVAGYSMFNIIKKGVNGNINNYSNNIEETSSSNFNKYAITTDGYRYISVRNNNIIVYAKSLKTNSGELNSLFSEFGLKNRSNSFVYIFIILMLIIMVVSFWNIFVKAGLKGWYSLIPFYNLYTIFKVSLGNGWYILLMLVPVANFVIIFMLWYKLAKVFEKSSGFAVFNAFVPIIGIQIIAFDDSKYILNN